MDALRRTREEDLRRLRKMFPEKNEAQRAEALDRMAKQRMMYIGELLPPEGSGVPVPTAEALAAQATAALPDSRVRPPPPSYSPRPP